MTELIEVIENCKEYIDLLKTGEKGCFLIRGVNDEIEIKICHKSVKKRIPRDMPKKYHDALNTYFKKIFGWPVRNGVYTYGAKHDVKNIITHYGTTYLFFPIGKFQFVYDPEIYDLYATLADFQSDSKDRLTAFIHSINYSSNEINKAMGNSIKDKKSAEIIINCKKYYLINIKYIDELTDFIWH